MLRRGRPPRGADGHFIAWGSFRPRDAEGRVLPASSLPAWAQEKVKEARAEALRRRQAERRAEEERARQELERRRRQQLQRRREREAERRAAEAEAERQRQEALERRRARAAERRAAEAEAEKKRQEALARRRQRAAERRAEEARQALAARLEAERRAAEALDEALPRDASGQILTPVSSPRNKAGNSIAWADVVVRDGRKRPIAWSKLPGWLRALIEASKKARADAARVVAEQARNVAQQIEGDRRRFGKEIVTAQEVLEAVLVESRNKAIDRGLIQRWKSDPTLVRGARGSLGRQIAIGSLLDRDLVSDVREIVRDAAEEISDTMRDERTKVFVSIRLTEFGRNLIGSPTSVVMELPEGVLTQGWQAVRGGVPGRVAQRVGKLLERILSQSPRNAAIIEGVVVRGYIMRGDGK